MNKQFFDYTTQSVMQEVCHGWVFLLNILQNKIALTPN